MTRLREALAPETLDYLEQASPEAWDWDVEIIDIARVGEPGRGSTSYLCADGLMVCAYDAAVEPAWHIDGDNGLGWAEFSGRKDA